MFCFAWGPRDRDITVWVDPALNYVARRVLFDKRSTPSDPTIRTYQFDVKRFQYEASGPIVTEATNTLTIGPQPIFQSVGYVKVVNGKTIIETPLLPAKGADGKIIMQPARSAGGRFTRSPAIGILTFGTRISG